MASEISVEKNAAWRAPLEQVRAFARRHAVDLLIVAALVAANAFARWVKLEPIENGGDPLDAWYFVRQWAYDNHPKTALLDHHAARFGIHWITWLVQSVWGIEPRAYYLPALFASCTCVALTYTLGRSIHGRLAGILAALCLMAFPLFHSASSQLRRGVFEAMYALAALNCLAAYLDAKERRTQLRWLVACALATFLAYLVELPSLYITPAVALVLWLAHKNVRHIAIYGGILAGLFVCETLLYLALTHYSSRLAVVASGHLSQHLQGGRGDAVPFSYLLERFTKAHTDTKAIFYPFFVAAPILIWRGGPKARAVALATASFLFLLTFLVRSINPIVVFATNGDRYFLLAVPLALVADAVAALIVLELAFARGIAALRAKQLPAWVEPAACGAIASAGALWLVQSAWEERREPHALVGMRRAYTLLNDAFARGLPIIAEVSKHQGPIEAWQSRGLHWAEKGFIKDELLLEGNTLPDFGYATSIAMLDRNHRYIPKTLTPARVRELDDAGCSVRLRSTGPYMQVSPNISRLADDCGK